MIKKSLKVDTILVIFQLRADAQPITQDDRFGRGYSKEQTQ
jgi:hypothetical protein